MIFDDEKIRATILYHLKRKKIIGEVHTNFDTSTKGFPPYLGKSVKNINKFLVKDSLIVTKPVSYGLQVSLNKEKIVEINNYILEVLNIKI